MLHSFERELNDNSAKARESQDCSLKVLELQKKFDIARSQVFQSVRKNIFFIVRYYINMIRRKRFIQYTLLYIKIFFSDKASHRH